MASPIPSPAKREAIAAGKTRYFTGKPCKRGHVAERLVCNNACVECNKIIVRGYIKRNPEKHKEWMRVGWDR